MRCKLRINSRPRFEHTLRTRNIVQIGHRFTCENRIIIKATLLCAFDFRIPISALHKTHHHTAVVKCSEIVDPVDHVNRTLLIGLNGETKAIPTGKGRISKHRSDDVERKFKTIGFFRIDREIHVIGFGFLCEAQKHRHKLAHHTFARKPVITRMKCREFHRNARTVWQRLITCRFADGGNRRAI